VIGSISLLGTSYAIGYKSRDVDVVKADVETLKSEMITSQKSSVDIEWLKKALKENDLAHASIQADLKILLHQKVGD